MTRLLLVFATALVVGITAAGASPNANSASYRDSIGDEPGAPDISEVTISNDDQGLLTFEVRFANRDRLGPLEELGLWLDTDSDEDTGLFGFDDFIDVDAGGDTDFLRWGDIFFEPTTLSAVPGQSSMTVRINVRDLRNTKRFGFVVTGDANPYDLSAPVDFAPDRPPAWSYEVKIRQAPVLSVSRISLEPSVARAGRATSTSSRVTVMRDGVREALAADAKVKWTMTVGGRSVRPRNTTTRPSGEVSATWAIPQSAKGKQARITLTVTVEDVTVSRSRVQRVG